MLSNRRVRVERSVGSQSRFPPSYYFSSIQTLQTLLSETRHRENKAGLKHLDNDSTQNAGSWGGNALILSLICYVDSNFFIVGCYWSLATSVLLHPRSSLPLVWDHCHCLHIYRNKRWPSRVLYGLVYRCRAPDRHEAHEGPGDMKWLGLVIFFGFPSYPTAWPSLVGCSCSFRHP
ncbi:uncharacterized protein BCR38DRAFT_202160 [Pseudomassariella vexata]|uniref:Uncharacterized protein n=1 Tax=Pseudomassariella vexata TaxID=1141098 RepID=A0A1Y2DXG5_9PEZI|nr:uncharacterized protein BCR38DRAFT_202160 [Pseudomassariella vexata]ORY63899.1 hypothetical protein BCR38DRAFT_202160 [Pseudomassariella vexata]